MTPHPAVCAEKERTAIDQRVPATPDAAPEPPGSITHRRGPLLLLGLGLLLIGLNLRIGVASVGPVLDSLHTNEGLSTVAASLLTSIPVFAFGAFAFLTPSLTRRFGMHRLLGAAMVVLAAGILLRWAPGVAPLFAGTVLVGAAIAIGNVLLPAAIKQDFGHRVPLMMGLYSTALFVGAAFASGLTAPISGALGGEDRAALAVWAIPAVAAVLLWLPQMLRSPGPRRAGHVADAPSEVGEPPFRSILRDPVALAVTALMGLQSVSYYATLTWAPTLLQDDGMSATTAGWMLAYSTFPGILASLLAPGIAARLRPRWLLVAVATVLVAGAYVGLGTAGASGAYVWMTLLGLGQGASISLALTYIVWRSPDAHHTGHVSTMAQGFGYLLAGLGPLVVGAVHHVTDEWAVPLSVLGVLLVGQLVAGILASRPRHVGDARLTARA